MKFKEYVENLNKLLLDNPHIEDYTTVYSSDDEGNSFRKVFYKPTIGFFSEDREFDESADFEDEEPNAVCIN